MQTTYHATNVDVLADYSHGEGWIVFEWSDPLYGSEGLTIDFDFHFRRFMPHRSGSGVPDFVSVSRDSVVLRFDDRLAKRLELAEQIEITFSVSDTEFAALQRAIQYLQGIDPESLA